MKSFLKVPQRLHNGMLLVTALAEAHEDGETLPLEAIAEREGISQKFLEQIATSLRKAALIEGRRGQGGGYRLSRNPSRITIAEVIEAIEGPLAVVDCTAGDCPRSGECSNEDIWRVIQDEMVNLLSSLTVAEALDYSRH